MAEKPWARLIGFIKSTEKNQEKIDWAIRFKKIIQQFGES